MAAFGSTRPVTTSPDIALTLGTSQAALGPAISSKILDAGNLFDSAASRFDNAVQEAKDILKQMATATVKHSLATVNNL